MWTAMKLLLLSLASIVVASGVDGDAGGRGSHRGKGAPEVTDPAHEGSTRVVAVAEESDDTGGEDAVAAWRAA